MQPFVLLHDSFYAYPDHSKFILTANMQFPFKQVVGSDVFPVTSNFLSFMLLGMPSTFLLYACLYLWLKPI